MNRLTGENSGIECIEAKYSLSTRSNTPSDFIKPTGVFGKFVLKDCREMFATDTPLSGSMNVSPLDVEGTEIKKIDAITMFIIAKIAIAKK